MATQDNTPQYPIIEHDGRQFSIEEGKRWTKVPEILGGQRTALFFVDEKTHEVRLAESWKSPKNYALPSTCSFAPSHSAEFALEIVAKYRAQS